MLLKLVAPPMYILRISHNSTTTTTSTSISGSSLRLRQPQLAKLNVVHTVKPPLK